MKGLVKSINEACKIMGYDPKSLAIKSDMPVHFSGSVNALLILMIIFEAQNKKDKWQADYRPATRNYKYSPWPTVTADDAHPSGLGFSDSYYDLTYTFTSVGSRLVVGTSTRAQQLFKQHKKLYAELWFIPYDLLPKAVKIKKSK